MIPIQSPIHPIQERNYPPYALWWKTSTVLNSCIGCMNTATGSDGASVNRSAQDTDFNGKTLPVLPGGIACRAAPEARMQKVE